jgi:hypothetical protein
VGPKTFVRRPKGEAAGPAQLEQSERKDGRYALVAEADSSSADRDIINQRRRIVSGHTAASIQSDHKQRSHHIADAQTAVTKKIRITGSRGARQSAALQDDSKTTLAGNDKVMQI